MKVWVAEPETTCMHAIVMLLKAKCTAHISAERRCHTYLICYNILMRGCMSLNLVTVKKSHTFSRSPE